jgi:hypothetical protein
MMLDEWDDLVARPQFLRDQARRARRVVSDNRRAVEDAVVRGAPRTQSPLQAKFAIWFNVARGHHLSLGQLRFALELRPQVWIECPSGPRYRLDFAVEPMEDWGPTALLQAGYSLKVGAELDGHDFHERTGEQVNSRDRRDRDLAATGWRVLALFRSELRQNPMLVVTEVLVAAADAFESLVRS